jgi:hypothetical protein
MTITDIYLFEIICIHLSESCALLLEIVSTIR